MPPLLGVLSGALCSSHPGGPAPHRAARRLRGLVLQGEEEDDIQYGHPQRD